MRHWYGENSRRCYLSRDDKGNYLLTFSYYREFIDALKIAIPYPHRLWDSVRRRWKVTPGYRAVLTRLIRQYFVESVTDGEGNNQELSVVPVGHGPPRPPVKRAKQTNGRTPALFGTKRAVQSDRAKKARRLAKHKKALRIVPDSMLRR